VLWWDTPTYEVCYDEGEGGNAVLSTHKKDITMNDAQLKNHLRAQHGITQPYDPWEDADKPAAAYGPLPAELLTVGPDGTPAKAVEASR